MSEKFASMEGGVPKAHGYKCHVSSHNPYSEIFIHTSFPMRADEIDQIRNLDGVDVLDVRGRYRIFVTAAQLFKHEDVEKNIGDLLERIMDEHDAPQKSDGGHVNLEERVRNLERRLDANNITINQYPNVEPVRPIVFNARRSDENEGDMESTPNYPQAPIPSSPLSPVSMSGTRTGGFN